MLIWEWPIRTYLALTWFLGAVLQDTCFSKSPIDNRCPGGTCSCSLSLGKSLLTGSFGPHTVHSERVINFLPFISVLLLAAITRQFGVPSLKGDIKQVDKVRVCRESLGIFVEEVKGVRRKTFGLEVDLKQDVPDGKFSCSNRPRLCVRPPGRVHLHPNLTATLDCTLTKNPHTLQKEASLPMYNNST